MRNTRQRGRPPRTRERPTLLALMSQSSSQSIKKQVICHPSIINQSQVSSPSLPPPPINHQSVSGCHSQLTHSLTHSNLTHSLTAHSLTHTQLTHPLTAHYSLLIAHCSLLPITYYSFTVLYSDTHYKQNKQQTKLTQTSLKPHSLKPHSLKPHSLTHGRSSVSRSVSQLRICRVCDSID